MDELLIALERAGEPTTAACAESYLAMLADLSIDANKVREDAVYEAVLTAKREGAGLLPEGTYPTLAAFEQDYEPMGEVGLAAMAYAGMGKRYSTHHKSLRQMLAAITDEARDAARLNPYRASEVSQYTDLSLAKHFLVDAARANAKWLDSVRGPWAAKLIDQCAPGGEVSRYPHMLAERVQQFVELSKGYRAPREPAPRRRAVPDSSHEPA
ncbi:hypothetical protein [Cupriavidus sp. TMH.W2]|uniref:hypothetical protein n=1 Tax=Cupriavidus sp. TMH.W2 TaxID=3434465 RepID=UPI003D776B07